MLVPPDEKVAPEQVPPRVPKLRPDLVISQQGDSCVVKDPVTGRFFRFGPIEHFIVGQLDGSSPADLIQQRVEERFQATLEPGSVEVFVERLRRLGLLDTGQSAARPVGSKSGLWRGSILYLRLKAFDPDRLLDRLVGKVRFFFTPYFVGLAAATILLGFAIAITHF